MKKEFKAPIVEMKELSTQNSIMGFAAVISGNATPVGKSIADNEAVTGYNQWKGFSK